MESSKVHVFRSQKMKLILAGVSVASLLVIATSAYADDSVPVQAPVTQSSQQAGDQGGTISGSSAWGQSSAGLTRNDVRQQLNAAEQSGQIAHLNQTLYKGQ
jgi:hypothetical protein